MNTNDTGNYMRRMYSEDALRHERRKNHFAAFIANDKTLN